MSVSAPATSWLIYLTEGVMIDQNILQNTVDICRSVFYERFVQYAAAKVTFPPPPNAPLTSSKFVVLDTISNRWPNFVSIGQVRGRTNEPLFIVAMFREVSDARQDESFLALCLPRAVHAKEHGKIMSKFLGLGFDLYATQYYQIASPSVWEQHFARYHDQPQFAATVAAIANLPVCAYQFYMPGRRATDAVREASQEFVSEIQSGRLHLTQLGSNPVHNLEDIKRERDLWLDETDDDGSGDPLDAAE